MQPVDVLRPLALGQVALRPGERRDRSRRRALPGSGPLAASSTRRLRTPRPRARAGRSDTAITSKRDLEPAWLRVRGRSQALGAPAAGGAASRRPPSRADRRSGSPPFAFTSQKTSRRPRRTTMSSSYRRDPGVRREDPIPAQPVLPQRTLFSSAGMCSTSASCGRPVVTVATESGKLAGSVRRTSRGLSSCR